MLMKSEDCISGNDLKSICIVARTHKLLDHYITGLSAKGIRTYEIKRSKIDDRNFEGVVSQLCIV